MMPVLLGRALFFSMDNEEKKGSRFARLIAIQYLVRMYGYSAQQYQNAINSAAVVMSYDASVIQQQLNFRL